LNRCGITGLSNLQKIRHTTARDFNTQVFATTHRLECTISAHKAFSKGEYYDLLVHRLDREDDDEVKAVTFDKDDLNTALELRMDIRGVRRWA